MRKQGKLDEEDEESDATKIAVFPDKEVPVDEVGTPTEDKEIINKEGYKIDEKIKKEAEDSKLKNPGLQSVSPPHDPHLEPPKGALFLLTDVFFR